MQNWFYILQQITIGVACVALLAATFMFYRVMIKPKQQLKELNSKANWGLGEKANHGL